MADRKVKQQEPNQAERTALEAGRTAHGAGKGFHELPEGYKVTKSLSIAWRKGWQEAARIVVEIRTPQPVITHAEPDTRAPEFLDASEPLPEIYVRPQLIACRNCRMIRLPSRAQAVVLSHIAGTVAVLKCRACCVSFKLPVQT